MRANRKIQRATRVSVNPIVVASFGSSGPLASSQPSPHTNSGIGTAIAMESSTAQTVARNESDW